MKIAQAALASRNAKVELVEAQRVNCLLCSYVHDSALVNTYSFGLDERKELVAVYVFRPGHDDLVESVRVRNLGTMDVAL
jgi:hypothetical protein